MAAAPTLPTPPSAPPRVRPTGVTVLAILEAILSAFLALGGLALVVIGPFLGAFLPFGGLFAGFLLSILGIVLLLFGVVGLVMVWGMWTGRGWAWWLTIVFAALGVLFSLASLPGGFFGLILNGVVLYYFTRPHVKTYFGKTPVALTV